MADIQPWQRLESESTVAYQAFTTYLRLPVGKRSIDAAYQQATNAQQSGNGKRAAGNWTRWSTQHNWLARADAHDDYLIALEQAAEDERWAERRRLMRERDYLQGEELRTHADQLRAVVIEAIPQARGFVRSRRVTREDGTEVITLAYDIVGLGHVSDAIARIIERASKVQRLATNESTENIQLSGAALDGAIEREFQRLAHLAYSGEAGNLAPDATEGEA